MNLELLTITFAAGETKEFRKAGRYIEIIDSTAALDFTFLGEQGKQGDALGALSGLFIIGGFSAFQIRSAIAQTAIVLVTDGQGGSRRQPGNVRIIDNNADKTQALKQFLGSVSTPAQPGLISVASAVGLAGVVGSFKRLVVSSTIAGSVLLFRATAAGTAAPAGFVLQNKKFGSPVSAYTGSSGSAAALPLTAGEMPGFAGLLLISVQANQPVEVPLTTPLIVTGTQVLGLASGVVNQQITLTTDFEEL